MGGGAPLRRLSERRRATVAAEPAPIIVCATLGPADLAWADDLRRRHFPPERNVLAAHLTLFHHLPPARLPELMRLMRDEASAPPPAAQLTGLRFLGRGVALDIRSPDLLAIRARIADVFAADLIPQDRQSPRLHITIQNKVDPATARALQAALEPQIRPRALTITGLSAHYYRGGPWDAAGQVKFSRHAARRA